MTELTLSQADRVAIIFAKLLDPNTPDPDYRHLKALDDEYWHVVIRILNAGKDYSQRVHVFDYEALSQKSQKWTDLRERVRLANTNINLDEVTIVDTWVVERFADAYNVLPPQEWVIKGLFLKSSLNMFFGQSGSGKTLLVMDMALKIASDLVWLPPLMGTSTSGFQTVQMPVVWCDFENGRRRVMERIAAIGRQENLPTDTPFWFYSMPHPTLDASKPASIGDLIRRVENLGAGVVVVDHFGASVGDADENTGEMAPVMSHFRMLAETTGAACFLIHHQTKNPGRYANMSDSLRGHGSILANLDTALLVRKNAYVKDQITVTAVKARDAEIEPFAAQWTYTHKPGTIKELETAKFWGVTIENMTDLVDEALISAVEDDPGMNQTALVAVVSGMTGVGQVTIRKRIKVMTKEGLIRVDNGPNNSHLYFSAG